MGSNDTKRTNVSVSANRRASSTMAVGCTKADLSITYQAPGYEHTSSLLRKLLYRRPEHPFKTGQAAARFFESDFHDH